jgi:hypothetical protein
MKACVKGRPYLAWFCISQQEVQLTGRTVQAALVNDMNYCVNQSFVKLDYFTTSFNHTLYIGT